jgi:sulfur carrier protein
MRKASEKVKEKTEGKAGARMTGAKSAKRVPSAAPARELAPIHVYVNDELKRFRGDSTVRGMLAELKFSFPLLIVSINGSFVPRDLYDTTKVKDGDKVRVLHLLSGG